jgi:hypothetical protein
VHTFQHEDAAVFFYFTTHFTDEALGRDFDLARCQRAGKGAGESAACRCDDVVDSRGVRRGLRRVHTVVLGDLAVDAKGHRLGFAGNGG